MAPTPVAVPNLELGAGWLFLAPIGSTIPSMTVAAGVFSDAWGAAWIPAGATKQGMQFSYSLSVAGVETAEHFFPVARVPESADGSVAFEMLDMTAAKEAIALNGATLTTTGTGATALTKVTPPLPGAEVRRMVGWESADSKHRLIAYQTINTKDIAQVHRKGGDANAFNVQWDIEQSSLGSFDSWWAGTRATA